MSGRISIDNLSDSLKELINQAGLTEEQVINLINANGLTEEQVINLVKDNLTGDLTQLNTTNKTNIVEAINELFQSANNGKQLIANAIGEPVSADDTFSAMSNDINGLLATFKANMMNNGVTVESSDKFKSLIDKIATMVEEGSGKGIQFAEGLIANTYTINTAQAGSSNTITLNLNGLTFKPTYLFLEMSNIYSDYSYDSTDNHPYTILSNIYTFPFYMNAFYDMTVSITSFSEKDCDVRITVDNTRYNLYATFGAWYAIGVGEEDTTLRDSLADILGDKGVDVTEEDDMASLITKVEGIEQGSRYPKWYTHPGNVISTDKLISVECYYSSAIACGTNIYCMGGYSGPYGSYHTMNDCYNTVDNTITSKTPLPGQRARMALSSIDKFIYCMGGRDSEGNISVNHIYDTELDTFSDGTSTPFVGSTQNVSAVYNRKIHFIKSGSHSCYDPDLNAWTTKNPATFSVFYAVVSGVIKDKIYILPHYSSTEYVREYDPALDTWTNKAAVSVNGSYGAGGVIDDRLYYAAAYEAYTHINYYDPVTDSFNTPMNFSSRQTSRAAATLNGCLYLFGGCRNNDSSYRSSVIDIYVR